MGINHPTVGSIAAPPAVPGRIALTPSTRLPNQALMPAISCRVRTPHTTRVQRVVILAGGPATTWFPLAQHYPKLHFPLASESMLAHLLRLLAAQGITDAAVISSRASDHLLLDGPSSSGSLSGVRVTVVQDSTFSGTA